MMGQISTHRITLKVEQSSKSRVPEWDGPMGGARFTGIKKNAQ
jgi:hypothetical protein